LLAVAPARLWGRGDSRMMMMMMMIMMIMMMMMVMMMVMMFTRNPSV
jgi:hypothetical protein